MSIFSPNLSGLQKRYSALDSGGGGYFVPSDNADTMAWWKVSDLATAGDGGAVNSWIDRINSHPASMNEAERYPHWIANAGESYLFFDGDDDFLRTDISDQFQDFAIIGVLQIAESTHGNGDRWFDKGNGYTMAHISGNVVVAFDGAIKISQPYPEFTWMVAGWGRIGSNCYMWLNGQEFAASCSTNPIDNNLFRICNAQSDTLSGTRPRMFLKDLLVVNGGLSSGDKFDLQEFYLNEYGLNFI